MSDTATAPAKATALSARFGFIKFVVRDLDAMRGFYERTLGLVVAQTIDLPDIRELIMRRPGEDSGFSLILYWNKDGRDVAVGTGHGPLGLFVRDVDAAYAMRWRPAPPTIARRSTPATCARPWSSTRKAANSSSSPCCGGKSARPRGTGRRPAGFLTNLEELLMFTLPKLPYADDALEPTLSQETLHTHHDKHHRTYVEKTNSLAKAAGLDGRSLEEVVREAQRRGDTKLFHNAAQAWNHAFFWRCMTPNGGAPGGGLKPAIDKAFGSVGALEDAFITEGTEHFGSGWVWLAVGPDGLKVLSTHDADDTLIKDGLFPLLVCDLWEHAYYLDYKNDRQGFLRRWIGELADWSFAAHQFAASQGAGAGFAYPAPGPDQSADDRPPAPGRTASTPA
ncbi:Fe-Mn family superoxide dismutase [Phenylobacterium sp.]|uniref:Fe-Mn family superoxide dismutase n=1 Tax=Phenylobacterium sp. TaxID=1871053 RepID=UPI00286C5DFA|nr:Fe-Mn family superoxide dismutase [Phenylobacterium sp.]